MRWCLKHKILKLHSRVGLRHWTDGTQQYYEINVLFYIHDRFHPLNIISRH